MFVSEEELVAMLNSIAKQPTEVVHILGVHQPTELAEELQREPLQRLEDIYHLLKEMGYIYRWKDLGDELVEWARGKALETQAERIEKAIAHGERRSANRAEYLPAPVLRYYEYEETERVMTDKGPRHLKTGEKWDRWHGAMDLRAGGLLARTIEFVEGPQPVPAAVNLLNMLPLEEGSNRRRQIESEVWDMLNSVGLLVSGGRLAWTTRAAEWLYKMFPKQIDLAGYNHSLNAPILPEGFLPNIKTWARVLRNSEGVDLGTDGSGWYHPETPELQAFIKRYGLIPIQVRYINGDGVFAKGMLFPSELSTRLDNDPKSNTYKQEIPCITFDWLQFKGKTKTFAGKARKENRAMSTVGFLGIIQCWSRPGKLSMCFEGIENIADNETTRQIMGELVDNSLAKLREGGVEALEASLAKDDEHIKLMLQMVAQLNKYVTPTERIQGVQIPRIHKAVGERLGRELYHIATAGGIGFPRYVCRLDSTIPPGCVAVTGFKPGTKVAGFRFPLVLAQGLVTLEVIETPEHLLCNGEEIPFQAAFNPSDLVTRMQGDDDGDICGLSSNKKMLELWSHRIDNRIHHIEPEGEKFEGLSNSPEGWRYLQEDQRGPVGQLTTYRSRLLAVGDTFGALAMSILIQEAIDKAKRKLNVSNWRLATDLDQWDLDENGEYHFSKRINRDNFPMGKISGWVADRIEYYACIHPAQALGWKWEDKKIDLDTWQPTSRTGWDGGNLVHYTHNYAYAQFQEMAEEFSLKAPPLEAEMLVPKLLQAKGVAFNIIPMTTEEYVKTLRRKNGLEKFVDQMTTAMTYYNLPDEEDNGDHMKEERYRLIREAHTELAQALKNLKGTDDLVTTWVMECRMGKLNHAFRAICWPDSPILRLAGIDMTERCDYLDQPVFSTNEEIVSRELHILGQCLQDENPYKRLNEFVYQDEHHHIEVVSDDGQGVALYECTHCKKTIEDGVINAIREQQARRERKFFSVVVPKLNKRA